MSISLMRKTAINLKSICEQLEFDRNISTNVYYDYDDECCLSVCDDNITYCLVVFNEKSSLIEVRGSCSQHSVRLSNDYKVNVKHLYNIIKLTIEHMNDYNNSCRKDGK